MPWPARSKAIRKTLKVEDFWTFDPLNKALAKVGTQ